MDSFDSNKLLPKNIVLKGAQNHLYRIGLNLISNGREKRDIFHNPLLIFGVQIVIVIKSIVSLLTPKEYEKFLTIFGDFAHFFGPEIHFNIITILSTVLALISQLINYYNYKNGINPTYLKVFDMMSGLISPKSIGLTNKEEIYKLIKESKFLFSFCEWNTHIIVPLMGFLLSLLPFIINCSLLDIILFGIPHSILYTIAVHYTTSIMIWSVVYFYLICRYIKIKIKEQNDFIAKAIIERKVINSQKILRLIRNLNEVYTEVNEYDYDFWSLYLLSIWLIFGALLIFLSYFYFFTKMTIILKLIIGYGFVFLTLTFLFIISTASSVNYEANKIYKLLNQIMVYNSLRRIRFRTRNQFLNVLSRKVKVKINHLLIHYKTCQRKKFFYRLWHLLKELVRKELDFGVGNYLRLTILDAMK
jgi:hypothetical protein